MVNPKLEFYMAKNLVLYHYYYTAVIRVKLYGLLAGNLVILKSGFDLKIVVYKSYIMQLFLH